MPKEADRALVQRLIAENAQVVEVLGKNEYRQWHLPGARNIRLRDIDERAGDRLDRSRPVLVYCWDSA
ncbi:MAG TPA: rhodanese-like domain-containing protein [Actinomycetota bacterium]|nr:rhodanese-like domain-containing protein [Actinomycetota bacterium]